MSAPAAAGAPCVLPDQRDLARVAALLSLSPLVVLANFYLFVLLARIDLGHWPVFNDPDPRYLPANLVRYTIVLSFVLLPFSAAAALALSLFGRWRNAHFPLWRLLGLLCASAAMLVIVLWIDPGGFKNWFID
jgi:hypothetical protein